MTGNFEQQWLEFDYNPFILFNADAKVLSLNSEAQFLLGSIDVKSLYEIATTYASPSFGFKTTFIDLEFGRFKFFGITVGYENEDEIGIKLYQLPTFKFSKPKVENEPVNVYTLLDICISTNSIASSASFSKNLDTSIPDIRLNADHFIKILNKCYQSFKNSINIDTKLFYRVGEYIRFEDKKYTIFSITISGESFEKKLLSEIENLCEESGLYFENQANAFNINVPIIT